MFVDYTQSLEEEIRKLKQKCWAMEEKLEKVSKFPRKSFAPSSDPYSYTRNVHTQTQSYSFREANGKNNVSPLIVIYLLKIFPAGSRQGRSAPCRPPKLQMHKVW